MKWYVGNSIGYFDAGIIIILTGSKNAQMLCNSKNNDSNTYANIHEIRMLRNTTTVSTAATMWLRNPSRPFEAELEVQDDALTSDFA